jgi:hypothetical protein
VPQGQFETFLVENPAELLLNNVDPLNWNNIQIELALQGPSLELVSESIELNLPNAAINGRISFDTFTDLQSAVTLGAPSHDFMNVRITYILSRNGNEPANLTAVLLALEHDQADTRNPPPELRHVTLTINFVSGCGSQTIQIGIRYVGANDNPPVVTILDRNATFVEGSPSPVYVTNGSLTVTDDDNIFFLIKSAIVTILHEPDSDISNEQLDVKDPHGKRSMHLPSSIHVSYDSSTGVLTLIGDATPEEYSEILNHVTYIHEGEFEGQPVTSRTLLFTVSDDDFSSSNSVYVELISANDPPKVTVDNNTSTELIYKEGSPPIGVDKTLKITDPDSLFIHGAIITLCGIVDGDMIAFSEDLPAGVTLTDPTTLCFCGDDDHNETSLTHEAKCMLMLDSKCTLCSNATIIVSQFLCVYIYVACFEKVYFL